MLCIRSLCLCQDSIAKHCIGALCISAEVWAFSGRRMAKSVQKSVNIKLISLNKFLCIPWGIIYHLCKFEVTQVYFTTSQYFFILFTKSQPHTSHFDALSPLPSTHTLSQYIVGIIPSYKSCVQCLHKQKLKMNKTDTATMLCMCYYYVSTLCFAMQKY